MCSWLLCLKCNHYYLQTHCTRHLFDEFNLWIIVEIKNVCLSKSLSWELKTEQKGFWLGFFLKTLRRWMVYNKPSVWMMNKIFIQFYSINLNKLQTQLVLDFFSSLSMFFSRTLEKNISWSTNAKFSVFCFYSFLLH